jgi:hypothetical protein
MMSDDIALQIELAECLLDPTLGAKEYAALTEELEESLSDTRAAINRSDTHPGYDDVLPSFIGPNVRAFLLAAYWQGQKPTPRAYDMDPPCPYDRDR